MSSTGGSRDHVSSREYAVLLPLVAAGVGSRRDPSTERVLLCVRPQRDSDPYSGQVCLPGGAREPEDATLLDCALRETNEELGIPRDRIEIIEELDWHATGLGQRVKPFVGRVSPTVEPTPNPSEVRTTLYLPRTRIDRKLFRPRGTWTSDSGETRTIYTFELEGHEVWGLTARILRSYFV